MTSAVTDNVRLVYGSHLYGTETPQSDIDLKVVAFPPLDDLLLGRRQSPKRITSDDQDTEIYPIQFFLQTLCFKGDTHAIDLLHSNEGLHCVDGSWPEWFRELVESRSCFYTKKQRALVGYVRSQAAKYGRKGERLAAARQVLEILSALPEDSRLEDAWSLLPVTDHSRFIENDVNGIPQYQLNGRVMISRAPVSEYLPHLEKYVREYGKRAQEAEVSGNDWKALSHAIRVALQLKKIYRDGGFEHPLPEAEYLRNVKSGRIDLALVLQDLESLSLEIDRLADASDYPDTMTEESKESWRQWLAYWCRKIYGIRWSTEP